MDKSYSIIYAFYGVELRDDNHRLLINVPDLAKHIEDLDYEESIKAFTNQFNIRYLQLINYYFFLNAAFIVLKSTLFNPVLTSL